MQLSDTALLRVNSLPAQDHGNKDEHQAHMSQSGESDAD